MSDDDNKVISFGKKLRSVSVEEASPPEQPIAVRFLVLGEGNETEPFLAGLSVGAIIERLQQAQLHGMSYEALSPMAVDIAYLGTVEKVARFMRASLESYPDEEIAMKLWCKFKNLAGQLNLV
jgi:hypothetical protein